MTSVQTTVMVTKEKKSPSPPLFSSFQYILFPQTKYTCFRAVEAGVMLLCECGLDPGLDHMLAMEVIDKVIADGGQVGLCFVSKQKRQKLQQNTT